MIKLILNQDLTDKVIRFCESQGRKDYMSVVEGIVLSGIQTPFKTSQTDFVSDYLLPVEPKETPILTLASEPVDRDVINNGENCPSCGCNKFYDISDDDHNPITDKVECIACGFETDKIETVEGEQELLTDNNSEVIGKVPNDGFIDKKTIKPAAKKRTTQKTTTGLNKKLIK